MIRKWPSGSDKLLLNVRSPYQWISLFKDGEHYWLDLNNSGSPQFHTKEAGLSHRYMIKLPLMMAKNVESILIIGGGDGLAAKEALKFPDLKHITNVELDPVLCGLVKSHHLMRNISHDSFNHPKVKLIVGDGIKYLINTDKKYDVIIDDCDVDVTTQPGGISTGTYAMYLQCLLNKLTPGGIFCIMEALGSGDPSAFNYLGKMPSGKQERMVWLEDTLQKRNEIQDWKRITPYITYAIIDSPIGPEAFIYGSNEPMKIRRNY